VRVFKRSLSLETNALPELISRTIHRDGQNYKMQFDYGDATYFGDYHHPYKITEHGQLDRTTMRTFQYGFTPYVVGKVSRETVTVGGESFAKCWTYDLTTGFTQLETIYGITTSFTKDGSGNVASASQGGNTTSFHYSM